MRRSSTNMPKFFCVPLFAGLALTLFHLSMPERRIQRLGEWQWVHGWRVSYRVWVCHHTRPLRVWIPTGGGRLFCHPARPVPALRISRLRRPWHCRDCADNPGFSVRWNCILAIGTANSLLFLHPWTVDHATKTYRFREEGSTVLSASLFIFPKSTRRQTGLLPLSFSLSVGTLFILENSYSNLCTGDFLTFICFYAAEVKESHVVSFFSH